MRAFVFFVVLGTFGACSSGSDPAPAPAAPGTNPGTNPGVTPPTATSEAAQSLLEACGLPVLSQFGGVLEAIGDALAGDVRFDFNLLELANILNVPANWSLDLASGTTITGTVALTNAGALDLSPIIQNGLDGLGDVLASLPDGASIDIAMDTFPGFLGGAAAFSIFFEGGAPTRAEGAVNAIGADCQFDMNFADIDPTALIAGAAGEDLTLDFSVSDDATLLNCMVTIATDGTMTITAAYPEGETFRFEVVDGVLQPLP